MAENLSFTEKYEAYAGKTLGHYYLERISERVETGPIFVARPTHIQARQPYQLRLLALPGGLTAEERLLYLGHFQREASEVAALQHAMLLPLSDYGIFEGTPYLVSPDPSASTVQALLATRGPVEVRRASRYLDGIAEALEYTHQQGMLHLNLNALNVFIRADGQPLVAEVGLIRMMAPQTASISPSARQSLELENGSPLLRDSQGKPLYGLNLASAPAPELLLGRSPDAASDVYALGALLYYLLTGHRAQRGQTLAEVAQQHFKAAIPPLNTWRGDLPPELDRLLSSAMAKDPAGRPRTPGTLANAYAEIVAPGQNGRRVFSLPVAPPVSTSRPAAPQRDVVVSSVLTRRRALTVLTVGGGIAAVAGVAILVAERSGGAPGSPVANNAPPQGTTGPGSQQTPSSSGSPTHNGTVVAHTADVPLNSAKTFPIANSNNPGVLIHLQSNSFVAFNSTCTHAGCEVTYDSQSHLLNCPCHGAIFDPARNAAVVNGPATTPLTPIAITVNSDGTITTTS